MIPEIGLLSLIIALCLAFAQGILPLVGAQTGKPAWVAVAIPAAAGHAVFVAISFISLTWSFIASDFSVWYVAMNSNTELPLMYRIAAVWGGHEGSLLLWVLLLAFWALAVAAFSRGIPTLLRARILGVMGLISAGFMMFVLFTSNPFLRLFPVPLNGNDLNPLLQDPAMAFHPPLLYTGYVGFSVAFAFAVAAMLSGTIDRQWARWARPWTTMAWMFLTAGIVLGSWWAYYELGWGGWWFWDPVENASFMPWLLGTALIHSLAVTEKRGLFKSVTLLLAIGAFSLSLLGTFLVRSGVLVSVHAFASDPTRGLFILIYLAVVVGGALSLYAWRAPNLDKEVGFKPFSRETFLLLNNILLTAAAGLILLGTLYPLVLDAMNLGKISVGPPYFETVFIIPMLPMVVLMGVGMHTVWRSASATDVMRRLRMAVIITVLSGIVIPVLVWGWNSLLTVVGFVAGAWLIVSSLIDPVRRMMGKGPRITRGMAGMQIAHLGLGLCVLGITATTSFNIETDQRIVRGESVVVGDYTITFDGVQMVNGPNYQAIRADMSVTRAGQPVTVLHPEKRVYAVQDSPMTEAAIDSKLNRDLFIAMGDDLGDGSWSFRIQYKPLISFLWLGSIVMVLGGIVSVTDRRYRLAAPATRQAPVQAATVKST